VKTTRVKEHSATCISGAIDNLSVGVLEYWSIGKEERFTPLPGFVFPLLHHSTTPLLQQLFIP
jgi:hypothetical protein